MTQSNLHSDARPSSERFREERVDRDDDPTFEDPRIARERAEERERAEARDLAQQRSEQATLERTPSRGNDDPPRQGLGTSYLGNNDTDEPWQQWRAIQANFVDNPRSAVSEAHGLVGQVIDNIVRQFENERSQLEQRWSSGEDVSTEDLRKCLQTYRDFFGRLLATNVNEHKN
jgi:hypothetical protein